MATKEVSSNKLSSVFSYIALVSISLAIVVLLTFVALLVIAVNAIPEPEQELESSTYIETENPPVVSVIEGFISQSMRDLPPFPMLDFENVATDEESINQHWMSHDLAANEWLEANGDALMDILEDTLSMLRSSFSDVDFSLSSRYENHGIRWMIHADDIATDLVSDDDILYLVHIVRGISGHNGISAIFDVELNLNNGNQLFIHKRDAIAYTVAYREQENKTATKTTPDWWSIASAIINVQENTITWQGFMEDDKGNFNITDSITSPFN